MLVVLVVLVILVVQVQGIDCSIALTNALSETTNGLKRNQYMELLEYRVRSEGISAPTIGKEEGWALLAWCLFHQRRARRTWCSSASSFTPPTGISRRGATTIAMALLDRIRCALTDALQHAAAEGALRLVGAPALSELNGLPGVNIGESIGGEALVKLRFYGVGMGINAGKYGAATPNPLHSREAAAYIEKWVKWKVRNPLSLIARPTSGVCEQRALTQHPGSHFRFYGPTSTSASGFEAARLRSRSASIKSSTSNMKTCL